MGSKGIGISTCTIILIACFAIFFPAQQVDGWFNLSLDLTEDEKKELYKLEQRKKAEQIRDEIFVLSKLSNPYMDASQAQISSTVGHEGIAPNVITRHYDKFQAMKDNEKTMAEKKCKEILGGKTITNSFDAKFLPRTTIEEFTIDNQTGFMNRNYDDFTDYKLLQISMVEDYRDNNWLQHQWKSNPYANDKSILDVSTNDQNQVLESTIPYRHSAEFKKLVDEQVLLAENMRNEILEVKITGLPNPYFDEKIEDLDNILNESQINNQSKSIHSITINWIEPTYVPDTLEFNFLKRGHSDFNMVKAMEAEIAKNKLNKLLQLSNHDEIDINESDIESVLVYTSNKKPLIYERDDQGFEFFKNLQKDKAEKKLMEILGYKNIHNHDYLEFEKIKTKYYSNLN